MLKYFRKVSYVVLLLAAFLGCQNAFAKSKEPEAKGIQVGGFILHPGADVSVGYDVRGSQGYDDGLLDIGVHFKTRLADENAKSWDNNIAVKWRQFWGLGDAKLSGGIDVNVSSVADLFKKSFFRLAPSISYSFLNDPEDDYLREDFENHHLKGGVAFYLQPSAGAVFSQRIGYQLNAHFYTEHSDVSNLEHKIDSVTRWNFLPQTSMALNIDFRAITYLEDQRIANNGLSDEENLNASSFPIRIKYSLQGLLLSRLSYQLGLGYAYNNYDNGLKEHLFIMNARLRYDFTNNAGIVIDYKKDFENVIYGDYYKFHRVSLGLDAVWFEHLQTDLSVAYGYFDFRSLVESSRSDNLLSAVANIYYHFFPGLKLGLEYRLRYNLSNLDVADYTKHMITLNFAYEY